jgi:hypothetical protein
MFFTFVNIFAKVKNKKNYFLGTLPILEVFFVTNFYHKK